MLEMQSFYLKKKIDPTARIPRGVSTDTVFGNQPKHDFFGMNSMKTRTLYSILIDLVVWPKSGFSIPMDNLMRDGGAKREMGVVIFLLHSMGFDPVQLEQGLDRVKSLEKYKKTSFVPYIRREDFGSTGRFLYRFWLHDEAITTPASWELDPELYIASLVGGELETELDTDHFHLDLDNPAHVVAGLLRAKREKGTIHLHWDHWATKYHRFTIQMLLPLIGERISVQGKRKQFNKDLVLAEYMKKKNFLDTLNHELFPYPGERFFTLTFETEVQVRLDKIDRRGRNNHRVEKLGRFINGEYELQPLELYEKHGETSELIRASKLEPSEVTPMLRGFVWIENAVDGGKFDRAVAAMVDSLFPVFHEFRKQGKDLPKAMSLGTTLGGKGEGFWLFVEHTEIREGSRTQGTQRVVGTRLILATSYPLEVVAKIVKTEDRGLEVFL